METDSNRTKTPSPKKGMELQSVLLEIVGQLYIDQILQYMFGTVSLALLKGKFKANISKWKPLPSKEEQGEAIRGAHGYWQI